MSYQKTRQENGAAERLFPTERERAENYYTSKGIGPTAQERWEHFRDDSQLHHVIFNHLNFDHDRTNTAHELSWFEYLQWSEQAEV